MRKGIAASRGYAIGKAFIKFSSDVCVIETNIKDIDKEIERFSSTIMLSKVQLEKIRTKAAVNLGEDKAAVFDSHLMLLDDPEFTGAIFKDISEKHINAEKAVKNIVNMFVDIFQSMKDEYMMERAADVRDVGNRLLSNLTNKRCEDLNIYDKDTILVAHELTPSDTAGLDKDKVIAFITDVGGKTSHTAIMARTMGIPAIVGMEDIVQSVKEGDTLIVDGEEGIVVINPDEKTLKDYETKAEKYLKEKERLKGLIDIKAITKEGKYVQVAGNIGKPEDVAGVLENGGEGIGLFRTEFLYMDRESIPTEEEQYEAYKAVLEKMGGKPVVIRTLDIGGDKKLTYLDMPEEMNPFLGYRAIRLCLDRKDIFKIQLRALLRASIYGDLRIMFPMISYLTEFLDAKEFLLQCEKELDEEGIPYSDKIELGIMVEVPSAALMADEFAKHVDFFSIGTNDLIQYTMAVDRMNEKVSYLYKPSSAAIAKLVKMTIEAAHNQGKWCGMCGEMASDEKFISMLVEWGIDELSMSSNAILKAKEIIINS